MIFKWFDATDAEQFGMTMADFFAERVSVDSLPSNDKKSVRKASEVTSKVMAKVEEFRKNHKLNTYQKAKLAKTVQTELLSRGYHPEVVKDLINILVRAV